MEVVQLVAQRGDLAHLVLFLWALSSTAMLGWALKALLGSTQRFDEFIRQIQSFNAAMRDDEWMP